VKICCTPPPSREANSNSELGFVVEIEESIAAFIVEKANLLFTCAVE
jgi:hypothetical protein